MRFAASITCLLGASLLGGCAGAGNRSVDETAKPLPAPAPAPSAVAAARERSTTPAAASGDSASSDPAGAVKRSPADSGPPSRAKSSSDMNVAWPRSVDGAPQATVVASVGGRDIPLTDLFAKWIMRDPVGVRGILDDLILSRIVTFEAAALGIDLPQGEIDAEVRRRLQDLQKAARTAGAPDLETFVQSRFGLGIDTLSIELADEAAIDLLASRCVRAWILGSDRRQIRAIAVDDQATADVVQARLSRGENFAAIAREVSEDPSREQGGRIPPVVRGDQPLARTAFATKVGTFAGPIRDAKGFFFLLVEEQPENLEGDWSAIGTAVELSLEERGIEDPEFSQWMEAMFKRYDIDITPFLKLAGR